MLDLAADLKKAKYAGTEQPRLKGKNIALIFEKTSTRTRCAFEVAAHDQGAHVTYLGPSGSQIGVKESMADTARVLGRMFDGIEYRGFAQATVEELGKYAGVPVWNGLTNEFHPTQILADFLTMSEHVDKPLSQVSYAYLGDARFNMGNSLMVGGAKMGMDVRIVAPKELQPAADLVATCQAIAAETGAKVTITDSARREPGWPAIQKAPATVSVALNRTLPDAEYLVNVEVVGSTGGRLQNGDVYATDKLKNGFKLTTSGTADAVDVRLLVSHPAM